jgi:hypothetical protein
MAAHGRFTFSRTSSEQKDRHETARRPHL